MAGRLSQEWSEGTRSLTPTLPGRHDRVPGGSLAFHEPVDVLIRTTANGGARPQTPRTATTPGVTRARVRWVARVQHAARRRGVLRHVGPASRRYRARRTELL